MEEKLNPGINEEMSSRQNRTIEKGPESSELKDRLLFQDEISHKRKYDHAEDNLSHKMRANLQGVPSQTKLSLHGIRSDEHTTNPPNSSTAIQINRTSVICGNMVKQNHSPGLDIGKDDDLWSVKSEGEDHNAAMLKPSSSFHKISECPICSEVCVNHLHYGGISCYSCKAFFRRSVTAPSEKLKCCRRGDEKCSLKFHCRNNCPFCRLNKCLKNGMKPELVLSAKNIDKTEGTDSPNEERSNRSEVHSNKQNKSIKMTSSIITENYDGDEYLLKILKTDQLIISQTALVNIMAIPNHYSRVVEKRIKEAESQPGMTNPDILLVAQMELAFLDAKECVSFFTESVTMDRLIKSQEEGVSPAVVFTAIQEYFVQLLVIFLKNCPYFQSVSWACQARLLRKNITEVSILLMTMCFERRNQVFRWGLGGEDLATMVQWRQDAEKVVEIDKATFSKHLDENIGKDFFKNWKFLAIS